MVAGGSINPSVSDYAALGLSVVHVVDNLRLGGTELNVLKISEALKARGVAVRVVLIGEWGPLAARYKEAGIDVQQVRVGSFASPRLLSRLRAVSRAVHDPLPGVVHSHDRYSNLAVGLIPRPGRSAPRYVMSHRSGFPASRMLRMALRFAFSRSDIVTANGKVAGDIARRMMPISKPLDVIPNFLEDWCFETPESGYDGRIPEDVEAASLLQLGFVGRLEPVKNVDTILHVARRLKEQSIRFRLTIVGDGSERERLEQLAKVLGLEESVCFLGELPRKPLPQRKFDILLLSSLSEGTPNVIVEAMASGVPVVATDVGGVSAVVEHNATGFLVPPREIERFAAAVTRLAQDGALRKAFGQAARERALSEWREEIVVRQLIERVYLRRSHS